MIDAYKELTPVVYGENAVKWLHHTVREPNAVTFTMHWHDRMELLHVTSGILELYTEEGPFSVLQGQTAVVGPRHLHGGFSGSEGTVFETIMFDVERFCNGALASDFYLTPLCQDKVFFENVVDDPQLSQAMRRLIAFLSDRAKNRSLEAIGCIYEILGILFRYQLPNRCVSQHINHRFCEILDYLDQHYAEPLSLKKVGDIFGYNQTYLSRRFRTATGMTFAKYVTAIRMEKAQKMLSASSEDIGQIAWQCGYSDVSYFSNCFKKHFHCSPTNFRKQLHLE